MIYGLGAAFAWGSADFGAALVSRRMGSFATVVAAQLTGVAVFTVLVASPVESLPRFHPALLALPLIGVSGALTYLAFYRALELGPIALVSPIAAGYAAIVIAMSLIFLHEHIAALALTGAAITIVGVVLASSDFRRLGAEPRRRGGVFFALLAMIGFGVGSFLIAVYAKDTGWFQTIYLSRLGSVATLVIILAVSGIRRSFGNARPGLALWAMAVGLLDIGGFGLYARGTEVGSVSITAAASVIYPLIPILVGVIYLRERPALSQWVGVAGVGAGLVLLALGR